MPNKTNKRKSSSNKLVGKLKLDTLKGRIILTVLIFAVIGGGYMVYKSYAYAFSNTWVYNISSNTVSLTTVENSLGNCTASPFTDPSKNSQPVGRLGCLQERKGPSNAGARYSSKGSYLGSTTVGKKYVACATVRTEGYAYIELGYRHTGSTAFGNNGTVYTEVMSGNYPSYTEICISSPYTQLRSGSSDIMVGTYSRSDETNVVYVSNVSLKEIATLTNNNPANPGK